MTDLSELSAEDLRGKLLEFQDRLADLERQNAELRRLQAQQPDEEDQRFHTLVEQAREGITLVNEQGYVTCQVNGTGKVITGTKINRASAFRRCIFNSCIYRPGIIVGAVALCSERSYIVE